MDNKSNGTDSPQSGDSSISTHGHVKSSPQIRKRGRPRKSHVRGKLNLQYFPESTDNMHVDNKSNSTSSPQSGDSTHGHVKSSPQKRERGRPRKSHVCGKLNLQYSLDSSDNMHMDNKSNSTDSPQYGDTTHGHIKTSPQERKRGRPRKVHVYGKLNLQYFPKSSDNLDNKKTGDTTHGHVKSSPQKMKRGRPRKKAHVCGRCGYTTRLSYRFRQHVSLHTGERPYRCDQCDYAAIQKVNLLKHMAGHARNSPMKCQQCGYSTNQQSALSRHLAVHLEQKATNSNNAVTSDSKKSGYKAKQQLFCDQDKPETNIESVPSTQYQSAQTNHMTTRNEKEAKKVCNATHMPSTVAEHVDPNVRKRTLVNGEREPKTKQGKDRKRRKKKLKDNNETKPFVCTKCGYATAHKRDFKRHMLKHSSEKPYKCDRCDYSAIQKSHLHAHMKGHTRNGLLKCKYCGFSSDYQSVVTRHEEVHLRKEADKSGNSTTSQGENPHVNSETPPLLNIKDRYKLRDKVTVVKPETAHPGEKPYKHRRRASNAEDEIRQSIEPSASNSSATFLCWKCQEIHTAEKPCKIRRPDPEEEERPVSRKIKRSASNLSKPFRCGQCAYVTNDVWKFDHHLLEHSCLDLSKKRYLCGLCSFTAAKKSSWDRHTLKHRDTKPFACNKCNFRTKYEVYLSAHAKRMHPSQKPKTYKHVKKHVPKFSRPRYDPKSKYKDMYTVKYNYPATAYSCKKCEYAAALKVLILRHVKTHT